MPLADAPLNVDTHRRGFSSTGISFNGWEPSTTLDAVVTRGRLSSISFSASGVPAVSIWAYSNASQKNSQTGSVSERQIASQSMIVWVNPNCGFLYPENYEVIGSGLSFEEAHESIRTRGTEKGASFLANLRGKLEGLRVAFNDGVSTVGIDWLCSFDIFGLPTEPRACVPSIQQLGGVFIPLDRFVEETGQSHVGRRFGPIIAT